MRDYELGKIYKIQKKDGTGKVYIGSTTQKYLCTRMATHRHFYNLHKRGQYGYYCSAFELFDEHGIKNCDISLVENYPCMIIEELLMREGHYIKTMDSVNKNKAGLTPQERYASLGEKFECVCGGRYTRNNKQIHLATDKHIFDAAEFERGCMRWYEKNYTDS